MPMQIFIKDWAGRSHPVEVTPEMTTGEFLKLAEDKIGIPDSRYVLGTKQLDHTKPERTLGDYNIQKDQTVYALARVKGGSTVGGDQQMNDAVQEVNAEAPVPEVNTEVAEEVQQPQEAPAVENQPAVEEEAKVQKWDLKVESYNTTGLDKDRLVLTINVDDNTTGKKIWELTKAKNGKCLEGGCILLVGRRVCKSIKAEETLKQQGITPQMIGTIRFQKGETLGETDGFNLVYGKGVDGAEIEGHSMPCGHIVNVNSMTTYLKSNISHNRINYDFRCLCPGYNDDGLACKAEWDYQECIKVAKPTKDEQIYLDKSYTEQFLHCTMGANHCPTCLNLFVNPERLNCVKCPTCIANGQGKDFCSTCMKPWTPKNGNYSQCGQPECDPKRGQNELIRNCPTKKVGVIANCPSYRFCPKCLIPIYHNGECKILPCHCGYLFCFSCLEPCTDHYRTNCKDSNGSWNGQCKVAPRQQIV